MPGKNISIFDNEFVLEKESTKKDQKILIKQIEDEVVNSLNNINCDNIYKGLSIEQSVLIERVVKNKKLLLNNQDNSVDNGLSFSELKIIERFEIKDAVCFIIREGVKNSIDSLIKLEESNSKIRIKFSKNINKIYSIVIQDNGAGVNSPSTKEKKEQDKYHGGEGKGMRMSKSYSKRTQTRMNQSGAVVKFYL